MDATDQPSPPRHVLVVDDDADIREVAQTALQWVGGWQVSVAAGGRAAIETAREAPPDAILLDVMMPDLDGPATVSGLRADTATATIPIILLTAKTQQRDQLEWRPLEVAGVIAKPFDPMTLADQVATLLGWTT